METKRLRIFADANILIRGVTFPRYPYEILRLAARHKIVLVLSPLVLSDARRYLTELFPEHLPKLEGFLATALVELTPDPDPELVSRYRQLVRDVKDVPVALAAIQARVDYLVSTDSDLTDVDPTTEKLRQMLAPGKAMRVGAFLNEIMGWSHARLNVIGHRRWEEIKGEIWDS